MTTSTTTLSVTFVSESAAYDNTFGWYNSQTGMGGILFADVEAEGRHAPLTPGVSTATFTVNTADLPYIQFFLVSNGYNINHGDADDLTGAIKVIQLSDGSWAVADVDSHGNVITEHGKPDILNGAGANALFTETSKNAGHVDYASSVVGSNQTAATLAGDTADGPTGTLAWEDLAATRNKHGIYGNPGDADYNDAVFNVSIVGGNHAPVANADTASVSEDAGATAINVLANDTDPDAGNTLHVTAVSTPGLLGTVTIAPGGTSISYTPAASFQSLAVGETATETFTYTVADQDGATSSASVTVTVVGANDAPTVAGAVAGSGNEGSGTFNVNLLAGASDVDHGAVLHAGNLVWTDTGSGLPAGFTFSGNAISVDTNNLAYNAMAQGETFVTHFSYDVIDEHGALVHQTATITIAGTNDAPTVSAAVTGAGDEGSGTFNVNLLQNASDVDHGAVLHVANLIWNEVPGNLPAGFVVSPDGNSISVDTNSLAYDLMAQGETFTTHFSYDVVDEHGALVHQTATINLTGTNDAPVVEALFGDSAGTTDPLQETNAGLTAAGTLTVTDVDFTDTVDMSVYAVSATGPTGGLTDSQLLSFFSVAPGSLAADVGTTNNLGWSFNSGTQAFDFLAPGEELTLHYTVRATDDSGAGNNIGDGVVTIHIAGTNDAPVITGGATAGSVQEDVNNQATGQLTAVDPDDGAQQFWSVVGGTGAANADFHFRADSFSIVRNPTSPTPTIILQDDFNDGVAPPVSPPLFPNNPVPTATTYLVTGGYTESGGKLNIDSDNAVSVVDVGNTDPLIGDVATVRTNIDPTVPTAGLKLATPFTVTGVFDLILPDSPRENYGIRLTDRLVGGSGNPPNQLGDNTYDLIVRQNSAGQDLVSLRHVDFAANTTTFLKSFTLAPPPGADQIRLIFDHAVNDTVVHASFEYLSGGSVVGTTTTFVQTAPIFAPGSADTEIWTRASIIAFAPATSDSLLPGAYGTLDIDQTGKWTYTLDNTRTVTQNLAEGQHATDTFTVQVADQYGATDTRTINIDVVGTNDAPVVTTAPVTRSLAEDSNVDGSGNLHDFGLAQFSDIDLTDTHTISATLQSSSLSGGGTLPAGLAALLDSAMTAGLALPEMGDGHGQVQWNFALADSAVQFLAAGQTLTLDYHVNVTDPFGASAFQDVTVTITGTNDAPVVNAIAADANEDTGNPVTLTASYTDVDPGTNTFSVDTAGTLGTVVNNGDGTFGYDPNGQFEYLAAGETATDTFSYTVDDGHGGSSTATATVTIHGENDAPVSIADTNAGDPVVESGVVVGGNTPFAGDPSAAGNVLANDTDVDHGDTRSVTTTGDFTGTYGTLHLNADGSYVYTLNNADTDTNALAQGESASDVFGYTIADSQGATASSTLTINITGTNDQPVITGGDTTGAVTEDAVDQATGQLAAFDPDDGAQQFWTVVGGTPSGSADFHFLMDSFSISRNANTNFFVDTFDDGNPPPSVPAGTLSADHYTSLNGAVFTETDGKLHFDSENAVSFIGVGNPDPVVGVDARLSTNIDPNDLSHGLKNDDNFVVTGVFDLILPDSPREGYGIRLTDRHLGGNGTPPDQLGDNEIGLRVVENVNGELVVNLRENNYVTDTAVTLEAIPLTPPVGADQIRLMLSHSAANVGVVSASFEYLSGGVVVGSQSFGATGLIFQGEDWVRAGFVASAPAINDSQLGGTYGTLDIDQTGLWTYSLDNSKAATQALAEGQHATDTFTVQVADEHGAFDTRTINIDVTGANDAPILQNGPVSRSLAEDTNLNAGNLVASGDANFSDIDLTDTHTLSASLVSSVLSGGGSLPAGLSTLLNGALTTSLLDPSTGDGHGQYHWDFALDNNATQFLAQGETLTLDYHVNVTDPFGASAFQNVTITITGTNDAPVVANVAASAAYTENAAGTILAPSLTVSDVDNANLASATVRIASGFLFGDVLAATTTGTGITANYDSANGFLRLTGSDTLAHYQQVLDSVTFSSTSDNPTALGGDTSRTIEWYANDGTTESNGTFGAQTTFAIASASSSRSVAIGDLNGDGKADLVAGNFNSNTVSVLLGNGNGTFQPFQSQATGASGARPFAVALADVNGDGKLDVVASNWGANNVGVLLGNGNGTFQAATTYATGSHPVSLGIADLNGDGKLDIVTANPSSNTVSVLLGNGNGTFQPQTTNPTGSSPDYVAVGDLNGDGKADLVVANNAADTVSVLLGNGNGTFVTQATYATGHHPYSVAIGDLNNDGKLDVVTTNVDGGTYTVLLGNGNGTFQSPVNHASGPQPISVSIADLNGDGNADLAIADQTNSAVSVYLGNGDGTFQAPTSRATGIAPQFVTVGDVNGDGRPDLAVVSVNTDAVSVLLNTSTNFSAVQHSTVAITAVNDAPVAFADFNGGVVEAGVAVGGNTPLAGNPSAAGNVLTNDTEVDHGDALTVTTTGDLPGTYGTLHLNGDGSYTYTLNNADSDTNALAQGESASDVFNYTIADSQGASSSSTLSIGISGTNDAPTISGPTTGSVTEDAAAPGNQATGQLTAFDPDEGATQTWTVVGGTASANADYHFRMDSFTVNKGATVVLLDNFDDGNPPPSSPDFNAGQPNDTPTTYAGIGSFTESGGKLFLDSNNAVSFVGPGTNNPIIGQDAIVTTNIDPTNPTQGLKIGQPFTISGVFDLLLPDSPQEAYGIRFTDRLIGGPGNPSDQQGNKVVELVVREGLSGNLQVALRNLDFQDNVPPTNLQFIDLAPPSGADQIKLILDHSATDGQNLHASFQYLSGGVVVGATQTFSQVGHIFQGENWGRAELVAYAPKFTDSLKPGSYGTLDVTQSGAWTYVVNNNLTTTQSLSQGQTAIDSFNIQVTDDHGATATTPINVTVVGTNDGPVIQTSAAARTLPEDSASPNLTATGQAQFSDVDLADTHTLSTALLTTSGPLSPTVLPLLQNALTATLIDPATGDGHGQYQWDFSLDNSAVQYLGAGQTLTLNYRATVTDSSPFAGTHASASQNVVVTITGVNDNPVAQPDSGNVVEAGTLPNSDQPTVGNSAASGNVLLNDTDVDNDFVQVQGLAAGTTNVPLVGNLNVAVAGTYGALTIFSNGTWGYQLDNSNPLTNALAQDQHVTDVFTYTMNDSHGGTSNQTITVNVTGTNDAPKVSSPFKLEVLAGTGIHQQDLLANASDPEGNSFHVANVHWLEVPNSMPPGVTVNADGHTISIDTAAFNGLPPGGFFDVNVAYDLIDSLGSVSHQFGSVRPVGTDVVGADEFRVNTYTTSNQDSPSVAALTGGGFVISWNSLGQDGDQNGVYAQRYNADGTPTGGEFQVNTVTTDYQESPSVVGLANGGFVISWLSQNEDGGGAISGSARGVYERVYDANGAPVSGEIQVNTYIHGPQELPSVAALSDGSFVDTWSSYGQDGSIGGEPWSVYGQHYAADGSTIGGEFRVNSTTAGDQTFPTVASLTDGGFVVTWTSNGQDGDGYGIYAQRYDSSGVAVDGEFQINTYTAGDQRSQSVTGLDDGGFMVMWSSSGEDGDGWGVYGRRYDAAGNAAGGEFRISESTAGDQIVGGEVDKPALDQLTNGEVVASWYGAPSVSGTEAYARIFSLDANDETVIVHNGFTFDLNVAHQGAVQFEGPTGTLKFETTNFTGTVDNFVTNADHFDFSAITAGNASVVGALPDDTLAAHSIGWVTSGGDTTVYVNASNSSEDITIAPDLAVHLQNVTQLHNSDFIV